MQKINGNDFANKLSEKLGESWLWIPGDYWYQEVYFNDKDEMNTLMPYGQPVVLFVNQKTGEVKTYLAKTFDKEKALKN